MNPRLNNLEKIKPSEATQKLYQLRASACKLCGYGEAYADTSAQKRRRISQSYKWQSRKTQNPIDFDFNLNLMNRNQRCDLKVQ